MDPLYAQYDPQKNSQISTLIYQQYKKTPTSSHSQRRSRSLFPAVKAQGLNDSAIVRMEYEQSLITPTSVPHSATNSQTQFIVTSLRGKSNMASTMDTKKQQQTAFEQHFKKQTHLLHEKMPKSSKTKMNQTQEEFVRVDKVLEENRTPKQLHSQSLLSSQRLPPGSLLDLKVIETWINDMLVEAELQLEGKGKSQALKKFGIDRKTLKTKGLATPDIDRIFRCLFVYSFGFYEMLMDILKHSTDSNPMMSQIWKVFGILLEYCSRGDFSSTVNELEKEKKAYVEKMESLLQEKEKQLAQIEERERERHQKLQEDVHNLSQQRDILMIEKTQVEEDYKQADIAFNDEVALRLKFEYRINEIHGIHRELLAKHNKLLDDIISSKRQVERLERDSQQSKRMIETLIIEKRTNESEINNLKISIDNLQTTIKGKDQQIRELDVKIAVMKKQENKEYVDKKEYEHQMEQNQLNIQNISAKLTHLIEIESKRKSNTKVISKSRNYLSKTKINGSISWIQTQPKFKYNILRLIRNTNQSLRSRKS